MNARLFRYASVGALLALSLGSALPARAAAPAPSRDGGATWTGWTYRGQSNQLGFYSTGNNSSVWKIYTTLFISDAAGAPIPGGAFGGFQTGNRILGIGIERVSGSDDYAVIGFDLYNKVTSSVLNFSSTGAGGWSCPTNHTIQSATLQKPGGGAPDYPATIYLWRPGATTGLHTYPSTPFGYTYALGEEGAIVLNGPTGQSLELVLTCASFKPSTTLTPLGDGHSNFPYQDDGDPIGHFPTWGAPSTFNTVDVDGIGTYIGPLNVNVCGTYGSCGGGGLPGVRGVSATAGKAQYFFDLSFFPASPLYNQMGPIGDQIGFWVNLGGTEAVSTVSTTPDLYMDPATKLVAKNGTFDVELGINNIQDLFGYQFAVTFDSTKLSATGAEFVDSFFSTAGGYTPTGWGAACTTNAGVGTCKFASSKTVPGPGVNGTGPLAKIHFTALQPGVWPVTYDTGTVVFGDRNGIQMSVGTQNASVTVYGTATFNGVVKLQGRATPKTVGQVVAVDPTSTFPDQSVNFSATDGTYSLDVPALAAGTSWQITADHSLYLYNQRAAASVVAGSTTTLATQTLWGGDATNNNSVDITDLSCVGGRFLGTLPFVCGTDGSPDLNDDGVVNILDLVLVGSNYGKASPQLWQ